MLAQSLAHKMKLRTNHRAAVIAAPSSYLKELAPLPDEVEVSDRLNGKFDWIQIFVKTKSELDKLVPRAVRTLKPESIIWISFPKGSSKIQTDLTRDKGWEILKKTDLKWITLISVNVTWSAFGLRPYRSGEARS
jgi:hypothetical protein